MIGRWFTSLCARRMGKRSHINRPTQRDRILSTTRLMRQQLGLGEDRRLA